MRLKDGYGIWLQKYDVLFLLENDPNVPKCIFDEIFGNGKIVHLCQNIKEQLCFDYFFSSPESISWICSQPFIVDYNKIKNEKASNVSIHCRQLHEQYNRDFCCERDYKDPERRLELLKFRHQVKSFDIMLDHMKGYQDFTLPWKKEA